MSSQKILFLKSGSFSNINNEVFKILKTNYPKCQIDVIDVWDLIKNNTSFHHFFINIYFIIKEYGKEIISGDKKWKERSQWFFATSYISMLISKKIRKLCTGKEYKFSFQTQSIFNGKINNIPNYIYTDHTTKTNMLYPGINAKSYMRSKPFINKCEIKAYQDATMIFPFGSLVAHSLITQYEIPKEKVLVVSAGSNVKDDSSGRYNPEKYFSKNILFVGVEWERKGGPILLEVFKRILEKFPDASLTIVGCSPKNITLPNCNIVGKIPVDQVYKYYNIASIFCLPTMREPFGIVFVEAMSYSLPIIANNIGSIPDLVQNGFNGYLIDNNVNQYTNAICKLFDNPSLCREMGENGYSNAQNKFQWRIVGALIKKSIDSSIAKPESADASIGLTES